MVLIVVPNRFLCRFHHFYHAFQTSSAAESLRAYPETFAGSAEKSILTNTSRSIFKQDRLPTRGTRQTSDCCCCCYSSIKSICQRVRWNASGGSFDVAVTSWKPLSWSTSFVGTKTRRKSDSEGIRRWRIIVKRLQKKQNPFKRQQQQQQLLLRCFRLSYRFCLATHSTHTHIHEFRTFNTMSYQIGRRFFCCRRKIRVLFWNQKRNTPRLGEPTSTLVEKLWRWAAKKLFFCSENPRHRNQIIDDYSKDHTAHNVPDNAHDRALILYRLPLYHKSMMYETLLHSVCV